MNPGPNPHIIPLKNCEACGQVIRKTRGVSWTVYALKRYCSRSCTAKGRSHKVKRECAACGKVVEKAPSHVKKRTYCSQKCRRKRVVFDCEICGLKFETCPSLRKGEHVYCGKKCQAIGKRKNNGQNQGRRSPEDLAWKAAILKRDNYKCQHCGTDRKLVAHHIIEIRERPKLRHDLSNGQTLCHNCHYYGVHNGMPNFIHGRYAKLRPRSPLQLKLL